MNISKTAGRFIAAATAAVLLLSSVSLAATYKDVPAWASAAVDKVTSLGYMSGDLSGNFNPNDALDKFETSKILAKMAGYKLTGATTAEQAAYDSYYKKYESFINQYVKKFAKWNSTTNKEVAFLLEKGVYTTTDLDQFVIIVDGVERLRALSKEEAAQFLVRLMGKESTALSSTVSGLFADDSSIGTAFRPYVYYLKGIKVVAGDDANKFNPKNAVTKVIMAALVYATYNYMNPTQATPVPTTAPTNAPATSNSFESISGTIAKLYSSFRAVQVSSTNSLYNDRIYILSQSATVTVNGAYKTYSDLTEGMSFNGVLSNGEIISINATAAVSSTPTPTQAPPPTPVEYSTIEGTVASVKTENGANYVGIEVRMLNARGDVYTETRTFALASTCTVTRGGSATNFLAIVKGDIIKAKISGSYVYTITLEQKNRTITGEIIDKQLATTTSRPIITVQDANGETYDLKVTADSKLYRRTSATVSWYDLRIGDSVDVTTEYDSIVRLDAYGTITTKDGYVKDVFISSSICKVTVTDTSGVDKVYGIVTSLVDPYTLKVGSKIRMRLDSSEIQSFTMLEAASTASLTGIVSYVTSSSITLTDTSSGYNTVKTISIDANTIFIDTASGAKVSYGALYSEMKVFIVFSDTVSNLAKTVTILSR